MTHFQRRFGRTVWRTYPPAIPTLRFNPLFTVTSASAFSGEQRCDATSSHIDLRLHWHSFWVTSIQEVLVCNWIRLHGRAGLYCVNTNTWMVIIHMRTKGNLFHSILTELRIQTDSAASILTISAIRAWTFNPNTRALPLTESSLLAPGITD
jgi:hypothetical protein